MKAVIGLIGVLGCASCFYEDPHAFEKQSRNYGAQSSEIQKLRREKQALLEERTQRLEGLRDELRNPSWPELERFLLADDTDTHKYQVDVFDCNGFALVLRDHAFLLGYRSAYVFVSFEGQQVGHALNQFTLDTGKEVYVDNTGSDRIAYVEKGKPYRTLSLGLVTPEALECEDEFCDRVIVTHFDGDLFSDAFFESVMRRVDDIDRQIAIFNATPNKLRTRYDNLMSVKLPLDGVSRWNKDIVGVIEKYSN